MGWAGAGLHAALPKGSCSSLKKPLCAMWLGRAIWGFENGCGFALRFRCFCSPRTKVCPKAPELQCIISQSPCECTLAHTYGVSSFPNLPESSTTFSLHLTAVPPKSHTTCAQPTRVTSYPPWHSRASYLGFPLLPLNNPHVWNYGSHWDYQDCYH